MLFRKVVFDLKKSKEVLTNGYTNFILKFSILYLVRYFFNSTSVRTQKEGRPNANSSTYYLRSDDLLFTYVRTQYLKYIVPSISIQYARIRIFTIAGTKLFIVLTTRRNCTRSHSTTTQYLVKKFQNTRQSYVQIF